MPGIYVAGRELQSLREAFRERDRGRMVVAYSSVRFDGRITDRRIWNLRAHCGIADSILRHLIYVRQVAQLGSAAAVICQTQTGTEPEIALDSKIPLLDVRILIVQVHQVREALGAWLRQVGRERVREIQRGLSANKSL